MKPEVRRSKPEVRSQKSGVRSRRPEISRPPCYFQKGINVFLTALFLLCGAGAWAATIQGTVLDPGGRPVARAKVSLLASRIAIEQRETDSKGEYRFEGLKAGAYTLVSNAPGLSATASDLRIQADESRKADLHLEISAVQQHVVVSASLGGALAPEIGSSVSVVTRQEMDDRDAQSVLDVLSGVPGVAVNQTGRRGGVTGVFIRGGNSNYNLVMIDGIPLNEFGGDFDFAPLPADGVDHVEITRGPESALYGSNAVTGVINIVTRQGEGPPHFTVLAEGGSFDTGRAAASGSGLTHGVGWAVDLSRLDSGGVVTNDRYRNQSAFLSLGYARNPRRQINFHFFGNANDAGAPGPYGSDPDQLFTGIDTVSRDKQNMFGYEGSYAEQFSPRFRQVVSLSAATNDYYFKSPFGDSYSNNLRGVLNTQSELTLSSKDFLVAGFEYNREQTKNTYIADANNTPFLLPRTSLAYFVENRWSPTRRLFVTTGVRADDLRTHSLPADAFGSRPFLPATSIVKINPRTSVAYLVREGTAGNRLGATRLHSSFGTGIRAANGFELAFTNNPRLKPEKSISFDAGVEQRFFSNRAVLDATYFYNRFEDQIVVLGGSLTNLSTFTSANLGNARAQGAELSFRLQPTRSLQIETVYTLLDSSILALENASVALSPFHVGQALVRRPRNSAFYNVTWQRGRLMLNTDAYIRGQELDLEPNDGTFACTLGLPCFFNNKGYTRADAGFAYRLPGGVEIYGRVNNFLNHKYEESFGFPSLRLNFIAGLKFTFPWE
ncbi:MAG TPA: TonB-dependent receptor [Terriglobia bacterium]|nr:TonB-dependent receptor [Terriglobia bacterium]